MLRNRKGSPDTASVQSPINEAKGAMGQTEEMSSTEEQSRPDPGKSGEEKRAQVEALGKRKLDAADD